MKMMKVISQSSSVFWLVVAMVCADMSSAVAADDRESIAVLRSTPAAGAVISEPPNTVRVWFDQAPNADEMDLVLKGADSEFEVSYVHTMGENDLMGMLLESIPDGDYVLRWVSGGAAGDIPFTLQRPDDFVEDKWTPPLDIGVVLYDGAEPLDVFGPLEMWMNAGPENIRVHLIAEEKRPIVLTTTSYPKDQAPLLMAQYSFNDAPDLDVLMVPGGIGTLVEVDNPAMIEYLKQAASEVTVATSVCTGSALYAKAGLLKGVKATGNKVFFDYITRQGEADWQLEARWVESGRFFTSSGVSAGIDMSLAVIARFFGIDAARMIAASTEYEWNEDADHDPFVRYANSASDYVDAMRERFLAQ